VSSRGLFADLAGEVNREEVAGVDATDVDLLAVGIGKKSDLGFNESLTGWAQPFWRCVSNFRSDVTQDSSWLTKVNLRRSLSSSFTLFVGGLDEILMNLEFDSGWSMYTQGLVSFARAPSPLLNQRASRPDAETNSRSKQKSRSSKKSFHVRNGCVRDWYAPATILGSDGDSVITTFQAPTRSVVATDIVKKNADDNHQMD